MKCFLQSKKLYQAIFEGLTFWSAFHVLAWALSVCSKLQPKGGQSPLFTCIFSNQDFKSFLCFLAASNPHRSLKHRDLKSALPTLNTRENQGKVLKCSTKMREVLCEKNKKTKKTFRIESRGKRGQERAIKYILQTERYSHAVGHLSGSTIFYKTVDDLRSVTQNKPLAYEPDLSGPVFCLTIFWKSFYLAIYLQSFLLKTPPPCWQTYSAEDLLVLKNFPMSWTTATAFSKYGFISLCSPEKCLGHSCSQCHMVLCSRRPMQGHPILCRSILPVCFVLLPLTFQHLMFSCLSIIVPSCFSLHPLITWCNEFLLFRGTFSYNHSWSKWLLSAALLCTLVFWAWLERTNFSPQLEMENSQMPLMNFKLLLFLTSVAAREILVIKLNNSY